MDRRHPSTAVLVAAGIVVVASLAALVALPVVMTSRTERFRATVDRNVEPAREALKEVNFGLSQQIASITRAGVTRDERYLADYRGAVAPQEAAMRRLAVHVGALGPDAEAAFRELERRMAEWHALVQEGIDAERLAFDANYPAVIEAIHGLEAAITAFQVRGRNEIQRLIDLQVWLTAVLVLVAAVAAAIVLWIIARLRALTSMLAQEAEAREAALDRERQLVRMRDEILGVVSHDLRSPLTTIALSTQLIPGSSPEEQSEHVDTILATTRRMQRLIQDLLDVTKIEHSRLLIRRDVIDPAAVTREVVASHEPIAASKQIDLQSSIDESLPRICGDSDRLAQALSNLIGNAFKFTPPGGTVRLSVAARDGNVRFEVSDSGPGIAPSDLPHLFEPFWQAKKTAHMGAGLGLKITRAIVDAHEGRIEVTNNPEGGACFVFEIPADEG